MSRVDWRAMAPKRGRPRKREAEPVISVGPLKEKSAPITRKADIPEFMTPLEVAAVLKASDQAVWRLIRSKQLKAFRVAGKYRILVSDFMAFLESQRVA